MYRFLSTRPPSNTLQSIRKKITISTIQQMYQQKKPIVMLTAHDYASAVFCEKSDSVDIVLVGDSLAMVALGYDSTLEVTVEEMLHHCKAVKRGTKTGLLVGDLPFGSYHQSHQQAIETASLFLQKGYMEAVKMEGGSERMAERIQRVVECGIPVMGHLGLTPQSVHQLGGYKAQAKTLLSAQKIMEEAKRLRQAGCFSLVLECIPSPVAKWITDQIQIPTIGIGSGPHCSGQVLVQQDMLKAFDRFMPKFCKEFGNVFETSVEAIRSYSDEVRDKSFPNPELHCYKMNAEEEALFNQYIKNNNKE